MKTMLCILLFLPLLSYGQSASIDTVSFEDLELRDGVHYRVGSSEPFTGFKRRSSHMGGGGITSEGNFVNGLHEGDWTRWYETGEKASSIHYHEGYHDGPFTKWYVNGHKSFEGNWAHGELEGLYTHWDEEGRELYIRNYVIVPEDEKLVYMSEDGTLSVMGSEQHEVVFDRADRIENLFDTAFQIGRTILYLGILFATITFLLLTPRSDSPLYRFSLHKAENRYGLLRVVLWGSIALIILAIVVAVQIVSSEAPILLIAFMFLPFIILGFIVFLAIYIPLLVKGFRKVSRYKKNRAATEVENRFGYLRIEWLGAIALVTLAIGVAPNFPWLFYTYWILILLAIIVFLAPYIPLLVKGFRKVSH